MISITERAVARARLVAEREGKAKILRVAVRGGGCSGLSYVVELDEHVRPTDAVVDMGDVRVVCDPKSLPYLKDTTVDYESNLMSGGFRFRNPRAKRSCSCGESFSV